MFEHKNQPVIGRTHFFSRVFKSLKTLLALITFSLLIGMSGYHFTENMPWLDAFLNAAMIIGGMGPVDPLHTSAGKLFAGFFAIYSGLFLIGATGIMLVPFFHRVLHKFHSGK